MVLWENHGNIWGYPLVNIQKAIENGQMAIEIVDLPIKKGDFP
jgi:guanylate kinase